MLVTSSVQALTFGQQQDYLQCGQTHTEEPNDGLNVSGPPLK